MIQMKQVLDFRKESFTFEYNVMSFVITYKYHLEE